METNNISKVCAAIGSEFNFSTDATNEALRSAILRVSSNLDEFSPVESVESPITKTYDMDMEIQVGISLREDGSFDVFCSGPRVKTALSDDEAAELNSLGVVPLNIGSYTKVHPLTAEQKAAKSITANVDEDSLHSLVCDWLFSRLDAYQSGVASKTA